jgi:hypothetical protein
MSNDGVRREIYNTLSLQETEDLVEIWQKNDRVEYSDVAFDIIQEILQQRSIEIPPQNEAVLEHPTQVNPILEKLGKFFKPDEAELSEFWEQENQPAFYDPRQVIRLEKWINRAAMIAIPVYAINSIAAYSNMQSIIMSWFYSRPELNWVAIIIALLITITAIAIQIGITYFTLKSVAYILKILMQFEFNSRGANLKVAGKKD